MAIYPWNFTTCLSSLGGKTVQKALCTGAEEEGFAADAVAIVDVTGGEEEMEVAAACWATWWAAAGCLLRSLSARPRWHWMGEAGAGGGVGRRRAPQWPKWAVKETVHPPSLVSRWREALPPQVQVWRNSDTAAWTFNRLDILALEARHSERKQNLALRTWGQKAL